jgi:adenylate cyclase
MKSKRVTLFTIAALVTLALLFVRVVDPVLVSALRASGFDGLQQLYPRKMDKPEPVRIVDIDEASLKKLGQWPWSRKTLADMLDRLNDYGAAVVAFDIVFPEADRLSPKNILNDAALSGAITQPIDQATLPDTDAAFAAAISRSRTVLAFASSPGQLEPERLNIKSGFAQTGADAIGAVPRLEKLTTNLPMLDAVTAGLGGFNIDLAGEQGVARQVPMLWSDGTRYVPALSLEALRVAQGVDTILVRAAPDQENAIETIQVGDLEIPTAENGAFFVHYRPNPKDLLISAADLLDDTKADVLRPQIDGHIVYIGTSAVGLLDIRTSALGETVAGVTIHAQATEQVLSGRFLTRSQGVVAIEYLAILIGGLLIAAAAALLRPSLAFATPFALGACVIAAVIYAFNQKGILLDATYSVAAFALTYLSSTAWRLAVTDKDGRTMRRMFSQYVAPTVLADIEKNPSVFKLGGEVRDVTVMFIDIANFTPLSEKLSPEELVNTVNCLWTVCTREILNTQGTIDKFIGDAVMAFWNAPVSLADHQYHAAKAALAIRTAVAEFNDTDQVKVLCAKKSLPPLAVRIGLASGPACVGNMGSIDRFNYSVLGDTVNIAARTESAGKHVAHDILIAGEVHPATTKLAILHAGRLALKGKGAPEQMNILVGDESEAASESFTTLRKEHDHLVGKLSGKLSRTEHASVQQLLDEVALRYPMCASYLRAIPARVQDFAKA